MPIDDPFAEDRMRQRLEILEAMSTVIDRRNELMQVVSAAANGEEAQQAVMDHFNFTSVQAEAALDLQVLRSPANSGVGSETRPTRSARTSARRETDVRAHGHAADL